MAQTTALPGYSGHKDEHLQRLARIEGQVWRRPNNPTQESLDPAETARMYRHAGHDGRGR